MNKVLLSILLAAALISCSKEEHQESSSEKQTVTTSPKEFKTNYELLNAMPNPIETTDLIKSSGVEYDNTLLNKPENVDKYNTEPQIALNLGVYSVDLGYTNLHNKAQDAIKFLDATRKLTDALKVTQFFDFEKIKKITQESKDVNELILTTGLGLTAMRQKLEEDKRGDVLTLIVVGGWIESLYLATQVAEKANKPALNEKIAEQKIVIEVILKELEANRNFSKHIENLYNDMLKIKEAYQNISVESQEGKASKVNMSQQDFQKLSQLLKEIRNRIIA